MNVHLPRNQTLIHGRWNSKTLRDGFVDLMFLLDLRPNKSSWPKVLVCFPKLWVCALSGGFHWLHTAHLQKCIVQLYDSLRVFVVTLQVLMDVCLNRVTTNHHKTNEFSLYMSSSTGFYRELGANLFQYNGCVTFFISFLASPCFPSFFPSLARSGAVC